MISPRKQTAFLALTFSISVLVALQSATSFAHLGESAATYKPIHGGYSGEAPAFGYQLPPLGSDDEKLAFLLELREKIPALFQEAAQYDINLFNLLEDERRLVALLKEYPEYDQHFKRKHFYDLTITPPQEGIKVGSMIIKPEALAQWKASLIEQCSSLQSVIKTPEKVESLISDLAEKMELHLSEIKPLLELSVFEKLGDLRKGREKPTKAMIDAFRKLKGTLDNCKERAKNSLLNGYRCLEDNYEALRVLPKLPSLDQIRKLQEFLNDREKLESLLNLTLVGRRYPDVWGLHSWDEFIDQVSRLNEDDLIHLSDKNEVIAPAVKTLLENETIAAHAIESIHKKMNHFSAQGEVQQKRVRQPVKLTQVLPQIGIFRGCTGGDCSSQYSFPYPNDPHEMVFFIEDAVASAKADLVDESGKRKQLKGYVSATQVTLSNGEKALYVITISGRKVNAEDTELILRGLEKEKERLGVKHIILPPQSNLGELINFPQIRGIYSSYSKGEEVKFTYQGTSVRYEIEQYQSLSGYNSASYDYMMRNGVGIILKLKDQNPVKVRLVEHSDLKMPVRSLSHYSTERIFEFITDLRNSDRIRLINRILSIRGISLKPDQVNLFFMFIDYCGNGEGIRLSVEKFKEEIRARLGEMNIPASYLDLHQDILYPGIIRCADAFSRENVETTAKFILKEMKQNKDSGYLLYKIYFSELEPHFDQLHKTDKFKKFSRQMVQKLSDPDATVRSLAAMVLGNIRSSDSNIHLALVQKLSDSDANVRYYTAMALGNIKPAASEIHLALVQKLSDPDSNVRTSAIKALGNIKPTDVEIHLALVEKLSDPAVNVYNSAVDALENIKPTNPRILLALVQKLSDSDADVRSGAAMVLGKIQPEFNSKFEQCGFIKTPYGLIAPDTLSKAQIDQVLAILRISK